MMLFLSFHASFMFGQDFIELRFKDASIRPDAPLKSGDTLSFSFKMDFNKVENFTMFGVRIYISEDSVINGPARKYDYFKFYNRDTSVQKGNLVLPILKPGKNFLIMALDTPNTYNTSNKEFNFSVHPFYVSPPEAVDLYWREGNLSYPVALGDPYNPSMTLYRSDYVQPDLIEVKYYFSSDSILHITEDTLLETQNDNINFFGDYADLKKEIKLPEDVKIGKYYMFLVADENNKIIEKNEWNNILKIPISIEKPEVDLMIYEMFPEEGPGGSYHPEDSTITLAHAIRNYGNAYSKPFTTAYFLSVDPKYDTSDFLLDTTQHPSYPYYVYELFSKRIKYPDTLNIEYNI